MSVEEGRVEGGRVDDGNKRGRKGAWPVMDGGREEASVGGIARGKDGAREQGNETSREVS